MPRPHVFLGKDSTDKPAVGTVGDNLKPLVSGDINMKKI